MVHHITGSSIFFEKIEKTLEIIMSIFFVARLLIYTVTLFKENERRRIT